ncbi:uncharacterized protein [Typha latifolia]|uniref:uncharacterized protein n=1 Tax=Typha latifolia TaxID=4733 RepID=UPI003C2F3AE1
MPLYKRKTFTLLGPPQNLDTHELVFQVRFTKEIFRDYQEYLKRLNLYRQRVWTCKVTGKSNLTYEEALVSERRAAEKVQQLPKELTSPVLRMIQYSTLNLNELVNKIYVKLQEDLFEGSELQGRKGESFSACRILKILHNGDTTNYKVGWIDRDKKVTETSVVKAEDLIRKRPPLSRYVLKVFIRESTSQNAPWVLHEKLAKKHDISTEPPEELKDAGNLSKKRKRTRKDEERVKERPIRYPIDDLLVQPSADDPILFKRPPLSTDFRVPMDCVGDLLMIWDFCSSFSRLLHLLPFSLTDFESAVCHKESNLVLITEVHSAFFNLLIKDEGEYFRATQNKRRKLKITLVNWAEYLCDFLEMEDRVEFSKYVATVKRGYYGLLDTNTKLQILRELVEEALTTSAIKDELDGRIDQQQALVAMNRDARKKKEEQILGKEESEKKESEQACISDTGKENLGKPGIERMYVRRKKLRMDGGDCAVKEKHMNLSGNKDNVKGQCKEKDKEKEFEKKKQEGQNLEREIEKLSIRTSSLGKDRNYNRYWFFRHEGRLFVEGLDSKQWGYYTTKEELDALMSSLNPKGVRERALKRQLEKFFHKISMALEKRSKDIAHKILLEEAVLRRSIRVRAQPRDNPSMAFLRYVNKWKEI